MPFFGLPRLTFGKSSSLPVEISRREDEISHALSDHVGDAGGIVCDTLIGTSRGWLQADEIQVGDKVLMADMVWQRVVSVATSTLWAGTKNCPAPVCPLFVPAWVLGNAEPMILLPEQYVLFEDIEVGDLTGVEGVFIKAEHLEGFFGIYRYSPTKTVAVIHLEFEDPEIVVVQGGTKVLCPHGIVHRGKAADLMDTDSPVDSLAPATGMTALDATQARQLLSSLYRHTQPRPMRENRFFVA